MDNRKDEIVFCRGGGCTAKLGPGMLGKVLEQIPRMKDSNLLIGYDSSDDGAVYKLREDLAVVQTLDFFPPMVEDPYIFGQIAAANALSDIYAMGGDVKTALNIVCFPENWDLNILGKIMLGGSEKVKEAGGILAGGHSIADQEVKYGLSVLGTIHPDKVFANNQCREGDRLILTKPLGTGIICTANRIGEASEEALDQAVRSMTTLNKYASETIRKYRVHGCTDVTGFGLLGHLNEMLGDVFSAVLYSDRVPYIKEAFAYAGEFFLTGAAQRNRNHMEGQVEFQNVPFEMEEILFDPQTSGGLLVSLAPEDGEACLEDIKKLGLPCGMIGTVVKKREKKIYVKGD
ncbi:MAG TPA: selenide, water dikinase SelD [Candidatus Eubacterium avistercoris]|uniref:Selenide, water dikinase n=1 Tax=Candidatus Eubacterium avistercoris TaxID=2838567 RepID=A0A9D2IFY1_9FIRM|nr:selenide, water dikinase SelD [Candidatus Eubacterium avistercoris]